MLEDSITSSPSKSDKSIHQIRWLRKNKRKKLDKSEQNHDNEKDQRLNKILHDFYKDSDEQSEDTDTEIKNNTFIIKKPSSIVKHFKLFELEKCLAMADRISANQNIPNKRATFPETQGFSTCQKLAGEDITTSENQELSFMITESELINCCHQAEKVLQSSPKDKELPNAKIQGSALYNELELENSILQNLSQSSLNKEPSSPQLELELVNSILQDFSQSPITKEQSVTNTFWQYTPEFRLRIKPKKTYSRKCLNQTRINLSNRLESITSEEEDNSNCSSLSIQEDVALLEGVSNPISVTNTSQRLCENLINLSAFFTQNSPTKQNSSNDSQDQIAQNSEALVKTVRKEGLILSSNIPDLVQEILTLSSKCPKFRSNTCDSNEDFYGFSSPRSENYNEIDLILEDQNILDETVLGQQNIKLLKEQNMDISPNVSDCESVKIDVNPQFKTNVNKEKCTDWNEDDYQDVFACIDTEKILLQHNISKNHPTYLTSSNNIETVIKYVVPSPKVVENDATTYDSEKPEQDTSSKTIGISGDARIMAAKVLNRVTDAPVKSTTNNCDNLLMNKDQNIFENPDEDENEDDEWNDDCDFFKNFRTPVAINESSLSNLEHNEKILKETFSYSNDFPSTSKMAIRANIGFQTAAGKCVAISKKAQESVQKLLKEFSTDLPANFACDELTDMKNKIYTKTHNLHNNSKVIKDNKLQCSEVKCNIENLDKCLRNSTSSFSNVILNDNIGFKTAKGKNIKISIKAQKSVEKLLNERDSSHDFGSDLAEVKQDINKKNSKTKFELSLKENNHKDTIIESRNSNEILNTNRGFQTANGKEVSISTKAQENVKKLLKEFKTNINDSLENDLLLLKQQLNKKNSNKNPRTFQEITNEEKATELEQPRASKCFTLTNKEEVEKHFSENNEDLANMILSEWPLSNHFNGSISSNKSDEINTIVQTSSKEESLHKNGKSQEEFEEQSTHTQQQYQDESLKNENNFDPLRICDMKISKYTNIGFQTAKGNKVSITAKAQLAVDKFLQEFRSDLNENSYEKDLMVLKSKIQLKNKELKEVDKNSKPYSTQEEECASIILSEWPLSPNKNSTPIELTAKRKLSIDNSDIPSPMETRTSSTKLINKELYTTKSLFTERKIRTPLNSSPVKSIIARKNLLSLTKRRKNKRNLMSISNEDDSGNHNEKKIPKVDLEFKATPIKSSIYIINSKQTPNTPILKDFFSNTPQTSTPRVDKITKSPQTPMDIDFKPIAWDGNNDVTVNISSSTINQTTKLSDNSCSNISLNSSNPSAKERIARLKMYGKAPAVSPILIDTHNSCRPSGLRRTRSMLKKKDKN